MGNLFNGINIGYRGLQAQKTALDVTGHNIANANNEGYSRQRAIQSASNPHPIPNMYTPSGPGQLGTGVEVDRIERIKDDFVESQINEELQGKGNWDKRSEGMARIENIFNEPSDSALNSVMSTFWKSLQDLSNQPQDPATRATVKQRGQVLVDTFHGLSDQLTDYQRSLNYDVEATVNDVNSMAQRIADLNKQIVGVQASGKQANDLMDERDELFSDINKLIEVQKRMDDRGNMHISVGGVALVGGVEARSLDVESDKSGEKFKDEVIFADSGMKAQFKNGELAGILHVRNEEIEKYKTKLDELAKGFLTRFNEVHSMGYDINGNQGNEFFALNPDFDHAAEGIELADNIVNDLSTIASGNYSDRPDIVVMEKGAGAPANARYEVVVSKAASGTKDFQVDIYDKSTPTAPALVSAEFDRGEAIADPAAIPGLTFYAESTGTTNVNTSGNQGSGANAIALADAIKNDKVVDDSSISDYYESVIATLGVDAQRSNKMVDNQNVLVDQLKNYRSSISGVSLDEEMGNMIKYQQAYNAAAKMITKTDELLQTLIGIVK